MRVGGGELSYRIKHWFRTGDCRLETAAAGEVVRELLDMGAWSCTPTVLSPFFLPEGFEEPESMDGPTQLFMAVAEHFREAIFLRQSPTWRRQLPGIPCTTEELKELLSQNYQKDEQAVLSQLADLGSVSAQIITRLRLTRGVVKEALAALRNERKVQCNLLAILGATRYKMITKEGICDTCCPLQACRARDTFEHMLECYGLIEHIEEGEASITFLLKMARKTQILDPNGPKPFRTQPSEGAEVRENDGNAETVV